MILIVGGLGAGKRNFVRTQLGYEPEQMTCRPEEDRPVLYDLQELDPLPTEEALLGREVVICNEVGCGVVPMDREDRRRREEVGMLCCRLAAQAQQVYRVTCGIGMRLK